MLGFSAISETAVTAERDVWLGMTGTSSLEIELLPPITAMLSDPNLDIVFTVEIYPGIAADRIAIL